MTTPIVAPAGFVPTIGIAFSGQSGAEWVDRDNPLPTCEPSFRGAVPIVPGVSQTPRRGIAIACTGTGAVRLKLADGSEITLPVSPGLSIFPFQVQTLVPAGTTAIVTCHNLI
ncbi:hypothetical protein [Sphingomonas jatrophae]|uniref:Uncharacterized protein n=1 Tax=Sphingomonas jatrophae TaxID=1166337 RepID=A0A1I6M5B5_9SPHN|nr:hypothetical protein [Sphingomonas jatrophae]SFS10890.1 hypothetical protein SAMN05192580_3484 [Sphingomonas jatrophae]